MQAMTGADDRAVVEVRTDADAWWSNTPWWFVSAGLHLVLLLVATLVSIERYMAVENPPIMIVQRASPIGNPIQDLERTVDAKDEQVVPKADSPEVTEEKRIVFPWAKDGDHVETNDGIFDDNSARGESLDFNSVYPGKAGGLFGGFEKNPGTAPIIGTGSGSGGGGKFGRPDRGGNEDLNPWGHERGKPGGTEDAVKMALKWLARHQNPDGSWGAVNHLNHCVGAKCSGTGDAEYDTGLTGLALLAYLGAGYTHLSRDEEPDSMNPGRMIRFGEVVKSGLKWLMSKQDPEGCVGGRGTKYMYNHTIAALALSEAYGMSATQLFKGPAQQAIDFIVAAQNPGRAWRYTKQCGDNDTSVTGWAVMALKSAELSELNVPKRDVYDGVKKWLDEVTNTSAYSRAGYNKIDSGRVFVPGKNEDYHHHESMTAVAMLCRVFMAKDKNDSNLVGTRMLLDDLPKNGTHATDYYYWYYGSLALFQIDGPKGTRWGQWNNAMKDALLPHQKKAKDGCANGSWTSEDERWGFEGGRVYATAINALTLEVYYRYPNVFGLK